MTVEAGDQESGVARETSTSPLVRITLTVLVVGAGGARRWRQLEPRIERMEMNLRGLLPTLSGSVTQPHITQEICFFIRATILYI